MSVSADWTRQEARDAGMQPDVSFYADDRTKSKKQLLEELVETDGLNFRVCGSLARPSLGSNDRLNPAYSGRMVWGQAGVIFSLACFWALAFFMVQRKRI
jgi:hypothetical protein